MARLTRTQRGGEWHHIMNRGARRLPVFGDDHDRRYFLHLTGTAIAEVDGEIHAYALMTNHFHLLARGEVREVSAMMKSLSQHYTRWFNDKYGLDGALFRGRFRSKPIGSEHYLLGALRYIHRNPIDEQTSSGWEYPWTSHQAYAASIVGPDWLVIDELRRKIARRGSYTTWVRAGQKPPTTAAAPPGVRNDTPHRVEWAMGMASDEELALLRAGGRGVRNEERSACALLCLEFTEWTSDALAARYGFSSGSGLRTAAVRARRRAQRDPEFAAGLERARDRLRPHQREAS